MKYYYPKPNDRIDHFPPLKHQKLIQQRELQDVYILHMISQIENIERHVVSECISYRLNPHGATARVSPHQYQKNYEKNKIELKTIRPLINLAPALHRLCVEIKIENQ